MRIQHGRGETPNCSAAARFQTRNLSRYYVLAIEPSLYGDAALVRAWGRIGSLGRQRLDLYASTDAAGEALELWLARKMRRGYAPAASEAKLGA